MYTADSQLCDKEIYVFERIVVLTYAFLSTGKKSKTPD
jgi:hypothetical protein